MSGDVAKIVLVPHERSHPFARRECTAREPLKVGRSVDKKRISSNNLIFDCRVLSRNHAVIRFENGKVTQIQCRGEAKFISLFPLMYVHAVLHQGHQEQ